MKKIRLDNDEGFFGVVLLLPTGVVWEPQTGGICCNHPSAEGILVPLRSMSAFPHIGCYRETLPEHEGMLRAAIEEAGWPLEVDLSRWAEAEEAWWPVVVKGEGLFYDKRPYPLTDLDPLFSFIGARGWLVTENCD